MKVVVSKQAVREYIREMFTTPGLGWQTTGDVANIPVNVSQVVDPAAAASDPSNLNFKPKNRAELRVAMSSLINDISDDEASDFYDSLKDMTKDTKEEDKEKMRDKKNSVEEAIRMSIRKMIREAGSFADSYSDSMTDRPKPRAGFVNCEACDGTGDNEEGHDCTECGGSGQIASSKRQNKMMTDVSGATFDEIAKEVGYASESGAKQAIERILSKAQYLGSLDPNELDILVLTSMTKYIDHLKSSGELTSADVQLLKDHPDIVSSLEGFREFLDDEIRKARPAPVRKKKGYTATRF